MAPVDVVVRVAELGVLAVPEDVTDALARSPTSAPSGRPMLTGKIVYTIEQPSITEEDVEIGRFRLVLTFPVPGRHVGSIRHAELAFAQTMSAQAMRQVGLTAPGGVDDETPGVWYTLTEDGDVVKPEVEAPVLDEDADACDVCGEWDLVGSGHEAGESCPEAEVAFSDCDDCPKHGVCSTCGNDYGGK